MQAKGQKLNSAAQVADLAILFALLLVFSWLESMLPPPPLPLPLRWGFSNLVVMYAVFTRPAYTAVILVLLRALFAFLSRGLIAFSLSLCGGLLAVLSVLCLYYLWPGLFSLPFLSICSAVAHQVGQVFALSLFYRAFGLINFSRLLFPLAILAYLTGGLNAFLLNQLRHIEKLKAPRSP
ncbi:MAG: Gx transporter family protein [Eubacteriales bacterium]|nr:Gx transporter family protein [Eubacteriales bacterium]